MPAGPSRGTARPAVAAVGPLLRVRPLWLSLSQARCCPSVPVAAVLPLRCVRPVSLPPARPLRSPPAQPCASSATSCHFSHVARRCS